MRILVLGGTVFQSAEIARQALAAGHDVTCLARGTASAPPDGATWLRADRAQGKTAYEGAAGSGAWDAVVDVSRDPDQAREALETLAGSARHWTFISSCSVYADHSVAGQAEDALVLPPLAPGTELTVDNYGEAKSAIEHLTRELAGGKAHLCRAGLIGGPGDGSDRYGYWPARTRCRCGCRQATRASRPAATPRPGPPACAPGPGRTHCGTPWRMNAAADWAANARPG